MGKVAGQVMEAAGLTALYLKAFAYLLQLFTEGLVRLLLLAQRLLHAAEALEVFLALAR